MARNRRIQEVSLRPGLVNMRNLLGQGQHGSYGPGRSMVRSDRPYKSKMLDALDFVGAYGGVREKLHSRMTFETLNRMARLCEPVAAIIKLRCDQAAAFGKVPRYESDTGFRITTRDPDQKVRGAEKKEIQRLQKFLISTGFERDPERPSFDAFLGMIVRDSLVYDAMTFEIVPGRNRRRFPVREVWPVDAATIRFAEKDVYQPLIYTEDAGDISYIQEIDGRIVTEYTIEELGYGIRNPTTNVDSNGYGLSELETLVNTVTGILLASQYNRAYFTTNNAPRGIINIVGNYSSEALEAFKRGWHAQLTGAANLWRTPIMAMDQGAGLQWVPLDQKGNRDMEFHLWLDYLVNQACALYGVNPQELGLKGYNPSGPSLSEGNQEQQVQAGEDKGLAPLMTTVGNVLNSRVLWLLNEDMTIEWEGLRADDRAAKQAYFLGWLNAGVMCVNEVRTSALDLAPIKEEWAEDAPAQATLYQAYATAKQAEMGAPMSPATAGGPMMPPNAHLNPAAPGGDKQGPPPVAGGAPQAGKPPAVNVPAGGPPQAKPPAPAAPKPPGAQAFGKSLADEEAELVIEFEPV
jgi:hypothetical protein